MPIPLRRRRDAGPRRAVVWLCLWALLPLLWASPLQAEAPPPRIPGVDALVAQAMEAGEMPGAVVLIGRRDQVLHRAAYGLKQVEPRPEPMSVDSIFDLASLTKPVVTGTSIMILAQRGRIAIAKPVADYVPEFAQGGKGAVTIEQLLVHTSGLVADNDLADYAEGREKSFEHICALPLRQPPGEKFVYSDVGFLALGMIVERASGQTLDVFARENLFVPLKMHDSRYCPEIEARGRIVPTEQQAGEFLRGVVHDPRARALGGVAGHAGLFSTADDLSRYARMILGGGELDGVRVLAEQSIREMTTSRPVPGGGVRTWGWDRQSGFSSNKGQGMSELAIGHGGFTGTGLWIDPGRDLYVIFLSSRLHPDGKGTVNPLIGKIGTLAVESLSPAPKPEETSAR